MFSESESQGAYSYSKNGQPVSLFTEIPHNRPFHCFQTVSDFAGILRDRKTFFLMYYGRYSICDSGASEPSNKRIGRNLKSSPTYPIVKMEARRENGALPNIPICHWPSQTIGDVYDVQISLVRKLWDGRVTVKDSGKRTQKPPPPRVTFGPF